MKPPGVAALCVAALVGVWPVPALANTLAFPLAMILALAPVFWTGLFAVTVAAEMVLYGRFLGLTIAGAVFGALIANLVSAVVGAFPIVFVGAPLEEYLSSRPIGIDRAWLIGLLVAAVLIPLVNAVLEYPVMRWFGAAPGRRTFTIVYATNFATTLPFLAMFYYRLG